MKLAFLELPPDERRVYIEQAAIRRNVSPVILEKDFWVCWMFDDILAALSELEDRINKTSGS
jgi:hypothetical protein